MLVYSLAYSLAEELAKIEELSTSVSIPAAYEDFLADDGSSGHETFTTSASQTFQVRD